MADGGPGAGGRPDRGGPGAARRSRTECLHPGGADRRVRPRQPLPRGAGRSCRRPRDPARPGEHPGERTVALGVPPGAGAPGGRRVLAGAPPAARFRTPGVPNPRRARRGAAAAPALGRAPASGPCGNGSGRRGGARNADRRADKRRPAAGDAHRRARPSRRCLRNAVHRRAHRGLDRARARAVSDRWAPAPPRAVRRPGSGERWRAASVPKPSPYGVAFGPAGLPGDRLRRHRGCRCCGCTITIQV